MHRQKEELSAKLKKALNDYTDIHTSMDVTNKRRKQLKTQLKKEEDQVVEFKKVLLYTSNVVKPILLNAFFLVAL